MQTVQSDLAFGKDTAPLYDDFDTVSINLNFPGNAGHRKICHSIYGEKSHLVIIAFAKAVK